MVTRTVGRLSQWRQRGVVTMGERLCSKLRKSRGKRGPKIQKMLVAARLCMLLVFCTQSALGFGPHALFVAQVPSWQTQFISPFTSLHTFLSVRSSVAAQPKEHCITVSTIFRFGARYSMTLSANERIMLSTAAEAATCASVSVNMVASKPGLAVAEEEWEDEHQESQLPPELPPPPPAAGDSTLDKLWVQFANDEGYQAIGRNSPNSAFLETCFKGDH